MPTTRRGRGHLLRQAFRDALGDRSGISRYGDAVIPMDETLVRAAVDSLAAAFVPRDPLKGRWIGTFDA
jgi:imidazoleglycerol-phosphate dehydratase